MKTILLEMASNNTGAFYIRFDLQPTEFCVRYRLHIDALPEGSTITLGAYTIGENVSGEFEVDVTDYLTLDDNVLTIHAASVGNVRLIQISCEENL